MGTREEEEVQMMRSGVVSVTFRKLAAKEIIRLAAEADLDGIEWGGDVHVPHGAQEVAREVGEATRQSGLRVASYGSYYRAGHSEADGLAFATVLETARVLQAPLIRVWAGRKGTKDADEAYRRAVVDDLHRVSCLAQAAGVRVACEYHAGSLTDRSDSACRLMQEVGHANLSLYWQPRVGASREQCTRELKEVQPFLSNLHVFQWQASPKGIDRRPLAEGRAAWSEYVASVGRGRETRWALLEFVRGNDPQQLLQDAKVLRELVQE